jgi:hypothetical protein
MAIPQGDLFGRQSSDMEPSDEDGTDADPDEATGDDQQKDWDPNGINDSTILPLWRTLKEPLEERGYQLKRCGASAPLDTERFDPENGYFQSGYTSKPIRWLFWIEEDDGGIVASLPEHEKRDQLGYFNTSSNVVGLWVRPVPVVENSGRYEFLDDWEWTLVVYLAQPLREEVGSSSLVKGFTPPNVDLKQVRKNQDPVDLECIGIHLFKMLDDEREQTIRGGTYTYGEATSALRHLLEGESSGEDADDAEE